MSVSLMSLQSVLHAAVSAHSHCSIMLITGQSNTDWSSVTDSISHPVPAAAQWPGSRPLQSRLQTAASLQSRAHQPDTSLPGPGRSGARTDKTAGEGGMRGLQAGYKCQAHRPDCLYIWPDHCKRAKVHAVSTGQLCAAHCMHCSALTSAATKIHSADKSFKLDSPSALCSPRPPSPCSEHQS